MIVADLIKEAAKSGAAVVEVEPVAAEPAAAEAKAEEETGVGAVPTAAAPPSPKKSEERHEYVRARYGDFGNGKPVPAGVGGYKYRGPPVEFVDAVVETSCGLGHGACCDACASKSGPCAAAPPHGEVRETCFGTDGMIVDSTVSGIRSEDGVGATMIRSGVVPPHGSPIETGPAMAWQLIWSGGVPATNIPGVPGDLTESTSNAPAFTQPVPIPGQIGFYYSKSTGRYFAYVVLTESAPPNGGGGQATSAAMYEYMPVQQLHALAGSIKTQRPVKHHVPEPEPAPAPKRTIHGITLGYVTPELPMGWASVSATSLPTDLQHLSPAQAVPKVILTLPGAVGYFWSPSEQMYFGCTKPLPAMPGYLWFEYTVLERGLPTLTPPPLVALSRPAGVGGDTTVPDPINPEHCTVVFHCDSKGQNCTSQRICTDENRMLEGSPSGLGLTMAQQDDGSTAKSTGDTLLAQAKTDLAALKQSSESVTAAQVSSEFNQAIQSYATAASNAGTAASNAYNAIVAASSKGQSDPSAISANSNVSAITGYQSAIGSDYTKAQAIGDPTLTDPTSYAVDAQTQAQNAVSAADTAISTASAWSSAPTPGPTPTPPPVVVPVPGPGPVVPAAPASPSSAAKPILIVGAAAGIGIVGYALYKKYVHPLRMKTVRNSRMPTRVA